MSRSQLVVNHHLLYLLIQLQKAHGVGDSRSALGNAVRHLILLQVKLCQKALVCQRFFNRIQVLSLDVLDQRDLHDLLLGQLLDNDRNFLDTGLLRCTPTPLTGDDLIIIVSLLDQKRLQYAKLLNGFRQIIQRILIKFLSRLVAVRLHLRNVEHHSICRMLADRLFPCGFPRRSLLRFRLRSDQGIQSLS